MERFALHANGIVIAVNDGIVLVIADHLHRHRIKINRLFRGQGLGGQIQRIAAGKAAIAKHLNKGGHHHAVHRIGVLRLQFISIGGVVALPLRTGGQNFQRYAAGQRIRRHSGPVHGLLGIQRGFYPHRLGALPRLIVEVEVRQRVKILCQRCGRQGQL